MPIAMCAILVWQTQLGNAAQLPDTTTVAGCVTSTDGQPLPGVTVDVGGNGRHRTELTDGSGCYAVPDLSAGSYFVSARVQGFVSATRDNLYVESARSARVDFRLRVASICECLPFPDTLADLWDAADAVIRIRLTAHDPSNPENRHIGTVSRIWKLRPTDTAPQTLTFARHNEPSETEPYAVGQEFVMFLKWSPTEKLFVRMSSGNGTVAAFAIENDRIHSSPIGMFRGVDAQRLVGQLDSLASR
jgi:hypothetical protein